MLLRCITEFITLNKSAGTKARTTKVHFAHI